MVKTGGYDQLTVDDREWNLRSRTIVVMYPLLLAMRPRQWSKNLLVFFAFLFTLGQELDFGDVDAILDSITRSSIAFVLFSATTSAMYLLNDVIDVDHDRAHSVKRSRPVASGAISIWLAIATSIALLAFSIPISFVFEPLFGGILFGYVVLMVSYSCLLKNIMLLDVFSISSGFVIRAASGALVLHIPISPWLYACTGLGALLIALGKRRSELMQIGDSGVNTRDTLGRYSVHLVDQLIAIVAPSTLLCYTLYTFTAPNVPSDHTLMLTIPFVVYGLFRYVYIIHNTALGETPEEILLTDIPLIVSILMWLVSAAAILVIFE